MHRNDTKSNLKHLLDVSYNGVGLGGGVSPLPATTSLISAIFRWTVSFSLADIFACTRAARRRRPGPGLGIANVRCRVNVRGPEQEEGGARRVGGGPHQHRLRAPRRASSTPRGVAAAAASIESPALSP